MPLQKLPQLSGGDLLSLVTSYLWIVQPGVDREAVMRWIVNFFGSPETTRVWGVFVIHKAFEWGMLAFFGLVYYLEIPAIERFKVMPSVPWPWKSKSPGVRERYLALVRRSLWYVAKFHACVLVINWLIVKPDRLDLVDPANIPSRAETVRQVLLGTACAEVGFYFAHRALHSKLLYKACHLTHHRFADCTVYATMYVTVWETILCDMIPAGIPIVLFDMHAYTVYQFTVALLLNAFVVHCGYSLPLNFLTFIPLATESSLTHDLHHRDANVNFSGSMFLLDRVFGTYLDPYSDEALKRGRVHKEDAEASAKLYADASFEVKAHAKLA